MSAEPKRIPILVDCPSCSGKASVNLTKFELEMAVKAGVFDAYHIICNHSWTVLLDAASKANLTNLITTEF